eukprot:2307827-Amphidinium_carterae.3
MFACDERCAQNSLSNRLSQYVLLGGEMWSNICVRVRRDIVGPHARDTAHVSSKRARVGKPVEWDEPLTCLKCVFASHAKYTEDGLVLLDEVPRT